MEVKRFTNTDVLFPDEYSNESEHEDTKWIRDSKSQIQLNASALNGILTVFTSIKEKLFVLLFAIFQVTRCYRCSLKPVLNKSSECILMLIYLLFKQVNKHWKSKWWKLDTYTITGKQMNTFNTSNIKNPKGTDRQHGGTRVNAGRGLKLWVNASSSLSYLKCNNKNIFVVKPPNT